MDRYADMNSNSQNEINEISEIYSDGSRRVVSRIIGAELEQGFPAVCKVQIYKRRSQLRDPLEVFSCTGTLIAPGLVVFAAHCVERGLISRIEVTFELGNDTHTFKVGVHALSYDLSYRQSVIADANRDLAEKLQMSQKDIAFVIIKDSEGVLSDVLPIAMMPLQNLKSLKLLGLVTDLTAVGFGRYSNIDDVNRGEGGKKRSARFSDWNISNGMLRIRSLENALPETGEPTNIARGDSGGAVLCIYQGVPYLVGVISFYNYADARAVNISESFAVGSDLVDNALTALNRRKQLLASTIFRNFRQSYAPYGFNFEGFGGNTFRTIASDPQFIRDPRLRNFITPSVIEPENPQADLRSVEDVELFGEVKWFRDPKFQLALACAPLAIFAIMGLRLGLEFDDE